MDNYQLTRRNRFMQAIVYGAIAGAAISLLDRQTRDSVMNGSRRYMTDMKTMVSHPNSTMNQVKEATSKLRTTMENIAEDVAFISARMDEIKEIPPQLAHMVRETRDAFVSEDGLHHVNESVMH
ncbi:YtxH domain-containing protein [Peribacillus glennii]|uniref:YtxH domain-containing protein n=1 Tax=Peribacillus glennii TaxID=2303991 RepID=A0A372LAX1_9BACI|nr:YtxH domain-containing protein [Peribacillus glennii]RFU62929.1 YtxH domain-containing protein [Peribacillus glennii]